MPMFDSEQEREQAQKSNFLKVEDKMEFRILSGLYFMQTHFLPNEKKTLLHQKNDCQICEITHENDDGETVQTYPLRSEYYYFVRLKNEVEGIMRLPKQIFLKMTNWEQTVDKDKRSTTWVVSKTGSGLQTKYDVFNGSTVTIEKEKQEEYNKKLSDTLMAIEAKNEQAYKNYITGDKDDDDFGKFIDSLGDEIKK